MAPASSWSRGPTAFSANALSMSCSFPIHSACLFNVALDLSSLSTMCCDSLATVARAALAALNFSSKTPSFFFSSPHSAARCLRSSAFVRLSRSSAISARTFHRSRSSPSLASRSSYSPFTIATPSSARPSATSARCRRSLFSARTSSANPDARRYKSRNTSEERSASSF
ncbi:hypothetical protein PUNSTDRAFT_54989 [Punctularia strigosozonata HHB-11173 SS5]|uniref:uncharacterized protein n=1 Tax=Punctularia strigosozonata (strain HHB-11173) TaxID=741275 RepID=UPI00044183D3|nr:uncharacterized protein PUNSTDRAFT_54989 [Punctularia strigosozonata HHB-11173 SS5]EIN05630.1 hypothetical protein PUNSTDRAFT_54989 [Punctularia strigosozonata HHB-11173 SS5]